MPYTYNLQWSNSSDIGWGTDTELTWAVSSVNAINWQIDSLLWGSGEEVDWGSDEYVVEESSSSVVYAPVLQIPITLSEPVTANYTINSYSLIFVPITLLETSTSSDLADAQAIFNNSFTEPVSVDYFTSTSNVYPASLTEPLTSSFTLFNSLIYPNSLSEPLTSDSTFIPLTIFNPNLNEALNALDAKTVTGSFSVSINDPLTGTDIVQAASGPLDSDLIISTSADFQHSNTFIGNESIASSVNVADATDFTVTFTFSLFETVTAQDAVQTTNADLNLTVVENLANVNDTVFDNLSSEFEVYVVEQAIASFECIVGATPTYPIQEELNTQDSLSTTVVYELHVKEGPLRPMVDVVPHMINHIIVDVNSPATDFIDWGFVQADINKEQEPEHLGGSLIEARKQKPRLIPHA